MKRLPDGEVTNRIAVIAGTAARHATCTGRTSGLAEAGSSQWAGPLLALVGYATANDIFATGPVVDHEQTSAPSARGQE